MTRPLHVDLTASLLRELSDTWREFNANHFRNRLRPPVLALSDVGTRLGQWNSETRTLSVDRTLVFEKPWSVVREVLKHEVAHQFVDEVLHIHDQSAHGPTFENVCEKFGIDPRATGMPAKPEGGDGGSPVLRRISRLLALAESPNVHEAEAAMKTAQRLMLKHNIDAKVAAAKEGYAFMHLGVPRMRVDAAEHVLAGLLSSHFFVQAIWVPSYLPREGRTGRVLELCGTPSNLEVAAYVHGFLLETAERLWREHRRKHAIDSDKERRRFLVGVMTGFHDKLKTSVAENRREGLIWVGDTGLDEFLQQRYPRRSGGSGIGVRLTEAYHQGREAGRKIVLHKPVSQAQARGRLLGPVK
jgi:hypothetical protein